MKDRKTQKITTSATKPVFQKKKLIWEIKNLGKFSWNYKISVEFKVDKSTFFPNFSQIFCPKKKNQQNGFEKNHLSSSNK
jgi:hypothetical protein